ncbi:hypothetical protein N7539_008835 [Penicillium diatomitis]|uniref:Uncharacterized protein n=1 Tax=Penicillium diatomitis TaxID=2819901 RepID=A0A9X0BM27_9EURO|nr:uncharacterized protein N7539_008835 [Penicillium diatomitis]KAJ5471892.1 hypothetical protein N7539_008835 [Penicillium diatomitis]
MSEVIATMLLFQFEGASDIVRRDMAIAWSPVVLIDLSIIEMLVGMVCWYSSKTKRGNGALMAVYLAVLLSFGIGLSAWMFRKWLSPNETSSVNEERVPPVEVTPYSKVVVPEPEGMTAAK